ncbi:MAG: TIM barrel protein [Planctomycetota bacterium]|jgi:sugar phosphate isomerase/epimerase|nr:TIM barrel protein [Planctomycetota bacterium]MDP7131964.1 TIM barrel protein [Planctomycetota bacterium]
MRFSCATQLFQKHGLQAAIDIISAAGYNSLDLWSTPGRAQHLDPNHGREQFGALRQEVETHGLSIYSLTAYRVHTPDEGLSRIFKYLRAAQEVGAKVLITGTGVKKDQMSFEDYVSYLRPLVHKATDAGVVIALENHVNGFLESPDECDELLAKFGSDYLGIAFAGLHFHAAGFEPFDALAALGPRVKAFLAWDFKAGVPAGELDTGSASDQIPGNGQMDFSSALKSLDSQLPKIQPIVYWGGTESWAVERIEDAIRSARAHLKSCVENV